MFFQRSWKGSYAKSNVGMKSLPFSVAWSATTTNEWNPSSNLVGRTNDKTRIKNIVSRSIFEWETDLKIQLMTIATASKRHNDLDRFLHPLPLLVQTLYSSNELANSTTNCTGLLPIPSRTNHPNGRPLIMLAHYNSSHIKLSIMDHIIRSISNTPLLGWSHLERQS